MKKSVFLIIQLLKAPHNFMVLKKVIDRIKGNCYDKHRKKVLPIDGQPK